MTNEDRVQIIRFDEVGHITSYDERGGILAPVIIIKFQAETLVGGGSK